jgi:hypothetical protein
MPRSQPHSVPSGGQRGPGAIWALSARPTISKGPGRTWPRTRGRPQIRMPQTGPPLPCVHQRIYAALDLTAPKRGRATSRAYSLHSRPTLIRCGFRGVVVSPACTLNGNVRTVSWDGAHQTSMSLLMARTAWSQSSPSFWNPWGSTLPNFPPPIRPESRTRGVEPRGLGQ